MTRRNTGTGFDTWSFNVTKREHANVVRCSMPRDYDKGSRDASRAEEITRAFERRSGNVSRAHARGRGRRKMTKREISLGGVPYGG